MRTDIRLTTKVYTWYKVYTRRNNPTEQFTLSWAHRTQDRTGLTRKERKKERRKSLACRNSCVLRTIATFRSFRAGRMTPLTSLERMPSSSCILLSSIETSKLVFSPFCQVSAVRKQVGSRVGDDILGYACGGRNRFTHPTHHDLRQIAI